MCMASRIKQMRLQIGLTQEELANKLGLQKSAIAKYENGRVENIKRSIISKMSELFNCSPAYLMGWSDNINYTSDTQNQNFIFSDFEKELVINYRKADDLTQAMVIRTLGMEEKLQNKKEA